MSFVSGMVSLTISIILATSLVIPTIIDTNTSAWEASDVALWSVMTLAVIVGLVVGTFQLFGLI